ncbi:hypothetical protein [Tahibacter caeni]|uniref:hypothetical protein n=1 Tax=Tahibacter caeni TaxID=1453545 RepID=UPI00214735BB|nr:hypothetical protein [Tahibacter caeni]
MATRRLVFVHGRAQEHKDAQALKDSWVASLRKGLAKSNLTLPIAESDIRFPYYGQALFDRVAGLPDDRVAQVVMRGAGQPADEREFVRAVLAEVAAEVGVSDAEIAAVAEAQIIERGIQNWEWVQRVLVALDRHVPKASKLSIALATEDVSRYLFDPRIGDAIDEGVRAAMVDDVPTVVVSHSLGTVVAYKMLKEMQSHERWNVPLFVTLGSPLAISAIRRRLQPLRHPDYVGRWFNAMDPRDVVALYPLDQANFPIDPAIENKTDVDNFTDNRHGIAGYLEDPVVAQRIHAALSGD